MGKINLTSQQSGNSILNASKTNSVKPKPKSVVRVKLTFSPNELKSGKNRQKIITLSETQIESKVLEHFKLDESRDSELIKKRLQTKANPFDELKTTGDLKAVYNSSTGKYEMFADVDKDLYSRLQGKAVQIKNEIETEKLQQNQAKLTPDEKIAAKQGIDNSADKKAELELKLKQNQAGTDVLSAPNEGDQTVRSITGAIEKVTGTQDQFAAGEIGKQFNRLSVSTLHLTGKVMELTNSLSEKLSDAVRYFAPDSVDAMLDKTDAQKRELAQSLQNANTAVTSEDNYIDQTAAKNGYKIPVTEGLANKIMYFPDPKNISNAVDSAFRGDFKDDDGTYSDQIGKIIGGLNPAADVRDIIADSKRVLNGENGSYIKLGASVVGAIPLGGDLLKPILKKVGKDIFIRTEKELVTEVAEKLVKQGIENETAEKIAKEEVPKIFKLEIEKQCDEIAKSGHTVQRHGESVSEGQLDERAMNGIDPVTGTTDDAYLKNADGTPKNHGYSKDATKFKSKESLVKTEIYIKNSQEFKDNLRSAEQNSNIRFEVENVKLEDVFGKNYKDEVFGKTRVGTKKNPTGSVETDFTDGTVTAVFEKGKDGKWNLFTMFPKPKN
ncbi:MAG: hypothetical protein ABIP06_15325 [Pyrinomonadaceae bacterium]